VSAIEELAAASVKDLLALQLSPARDTIISDSLDVHLRVEGLVRDIVTDCNSWTRLRLAMGA